MRRTRLLLLLTLLACTDAPEPENDEAEPPPIGPGSDSTALIPPDTPESRLNPPAQTRPDSLRR